MSEAAQRVLRILAAAPFVITAGAYFDSLAVTLTVHQAAWASCRGDPGAVESYYTTEFLEQPGNRDALHRTTLDPGDFTAMALKPQFDPADPCVRYVRVDVVNGSMRFKLRWRGIGWSIDDAVGHG